jgi:steroid 5-alpha reductase family enzyme
MHVETILAPLYDNLLTMFFLMLLCWFIYLLNKNAGIVDIGWALCFFVAAINYQTKSPHFLFFEDYAGSTWALRNWIMTLMICIWSGRLAIHLIRRYLNSPEDPRYKRLKEGWGGWIDLKILLLFMFQGILAFLLSIAFYPPYLEINKYLTRWEVIGMGVWLIGVIGESLADYQLTQFKADPANEGKVCDVGLWEYSRHPNYFFEWIVWIGFYLFTLGSADWYFGIYAPIVMLILLLYVSGIRLTENQALSTKGEAYRSYQRRTNAFFPWFPKEPDSPSERG